MKEPIWILREVALLALEQSLAQFGGAEGLRDEGLLDSALGKPHNLLAYGKPSLDRQGLEPRSPCTRGVSA
jgi:death-on-curing protein